MPMLTTLMLSLSMQAAPVPQMRRRVVEAPGAAGSCAALPLDLAATIPVVEVRIGERPYRFAIDTGAQGHGRIKREIAEQLGLVVAGQARTPGPGGTVEERPIFAVPALTLGGIAFRNVELVAAPVIPGREMPFDGILGVDLFRNFTLTLDYANSRLHVGDAPLAPGAGVALAPDTPVPAFPLEIAGRTFTVHLDTGNQAQPLFLVEADARALPLAGPAAERGRARTSFGEIAMMDAPLSVPVTVGGFALPVRSVGWPAPRGVGNLGSRGLAGTVVRLDRRGGRLEIAASPAAATSCPGG